MQGRQDVAAVGTESRAWGAGAGLALLPLVGPWLSVGLRVSWGSTRHGVRRDQRAGAGCDGPGGRRVEGRVVQLWQARPGTRRDQQKPGWLRHGWFQAAGASPVRCGELGA